MPLHTENEIMLDSIKGSEEVLKSSGTKKGLDSVTLVNDDIVSAAVPLHNKRETRRKSPSLVNFGVDGIRDGSDATFEPTIDMMVNDFDDEQTLNEEEALADMEAQNPEDEIATLKEESEMPIEELLAKYGAMESIDPVPRKKQRKQTSSKRRKDKKNSINDVITTESLDETLCQRTELASEIVGSIRDNSPSTMQLDNEIIPAEQLDYKYKQIEDDVEFKGPLDAKTQKRSHLLDLYPEEIFEGDTAVDESESVPPLEMLYDEAEDEEEEEEDAETESDYIRKTIMVGAAYQANIPAGLSLYGDILPYENEDKLIWEPSQVTERDVEEYLVKARDIKSSTSNESGEELSYTVDNSDQNTAEGRKLEDPNVEKHKEKELEQTLEKTPEPIDVQPITIIKDNEQALHLLVQCGYDFKEALRRKRLNVLPLTDKMSSWSEEECLKFEEGIQKYGKDFFKIRQNLVRTRTMRELVQFYYLWKKSERRDQRFPNADTVDHMDIYLNESEDFGTSILQKGHGGTTVVIATSAANARKSVAKNFSIMTGSGNGNCGTTAADSSGHKLNSTTKPVASNDIEGLPIQAICSNK